MKKLSLSQTAGVRYVNTYIFKNEKKNEWSVCNKFFSPSIPFFAVLLLSSFSNLQTGHSSEFKDERMTVNEK